MSLIKTFLHNLVLTLLSWISILFAFAAGNVLVFFFAGFAAPGFGWLMLLALVLNIMTGILLSGMWFGEYEGKWDFVALLTGFVLACMFLATLVFIEDDNINLRPILSNYEILQVRILLSIPALTVFGCFLFLWKSKSIPRGDRGKINSGHP